MIFKKILLFAMFATAAGYCFADGSECGAPVVAEDGSVAMPVGCGAPPEAQAAAPVWPAAGSDADVQITSTAAGMAASNVRKNDDNIKIVSRIGADLVVENNINLGGGAHDFSGGASMLHPFQAPAGFNAYENQAGMPLLHSEMPEDDGGAVLSVSRSGRKNLDTRSLRFGGQGAAGGGKNGGGALSADCADGDCANAWQDEFGIEIYDESSDIAVNSETMESEEEAAKGIQDQVRSWVVANGQTLRGILQDWCDKEGWDLVWGTAREYPVEASAVFKGRFVDVASALVRNFSRATPVPYAKFYKGNRVLVITADEGS